MTDLITSTDGVQRPAWAAVDPLLMAYYDSEWGMPVYSESGLFERLCLEGFQSGLSWATILRKRPAFREAFAHFVPEAAAAFTEADVERLLADPGIIRNRRKIEAVIDNARATLALRDDGGLAALLWGYRPEHNLCPETAADIPTATPESTALARELKRRGFRFVGPVTVFALMQAVGIVDAHIMSDPRRGTSGVWPR